ncbi:DUF4422 domain-containing protein [Blautia sp. HCP3S3_C4]|uniref:DUF4422 domain-containing protein n=1 Tax=Blautia sp. HCP3S3_C4 TaxID=3438911 RepID=UPI003F8944D3
MIYIAAHKTFDHPNLDGYVILQVGAEGKQDLGYIRDNTGDNISYKNPNFCELTGLYWIWKNTDDDYKGLVHYRRYFGKRNLSNSFSDVYSYRYLLDIAKKVDIVLPYVEYFKQNAKEEILTQCCTPEIFEKLQDIICQKYPEYINAFNEFFSDNRSVLFNMMFCKKDIFDRYCEWLFDILFQLEKDVNINLLNDYQKRLYGFLSERLLNVWINKNHLTTRNVCVVNTEAKKGELLKLLMRRIYHRITFRRN